MLNLPTSVRVYLAAEPVDLRRGHDGLVAIVRTTWQLNPFDGHLFVFVGKRLDRIKILVWDRNGFVLYYKRLSQGRFKLPRIPAGVERVEMDATTLTMLLDGIDVKYVRRPVHWSAPHGARGTLALRASHRIHRTVLDRSSHDPTHRGVDVRPL